MTITFHQDWDVGTLSSGTYTQAPPEAPNAHTWTFANNAAITAGGSAWASQSYVDLSAQWNAKAYTTVGATQWPNTATGGFRFLITASVTNAAGGEIYQVDNGGAQKFRILITSGGGLRIYYDYNGSDAHDMDFVAGTPTRDGTPWYLEVIYDPQNATASQRLRARWWYVVGGSPPSSWTASVQYGTIQTRSQFTNARIDGEQSASGLRVARIWVSDDITEDLSLLTVESAAKIARNMHLNRMMRGS